MTDLEVLDASGSRKDCRQFESGTRGSRNRGRAALMLLACAALTAPFLRPPRPILLWNATASATTGLYRVTAPGRPRLGETVVAWAPPWARRLAAERNYLPITVPLVKPVAATAGDRVCAVGEQILINGRISVTRRSHDPGGRPMPWWNGCKALQPGELFLLSPTVIQAFDGRYFGITRRAELIGRAKLLWAEPTKGSNDG